MRKPGRILVAVKDPAARALPPAVAKAAQLARASDADLTLFHSMTPPAWYDVLASRHTSVAQLAEQQRKEILRRMELLAARLRKQGVNVSTAVTTDSPAYEAIIRTALRTGANLIVVAAHSAHSSLPWRPQLTDWELLRHSPIPVLLVKTARPYRHPVVLAAVDPTHAFAKSSKLDDDILDAAANLCSTMRGTLHAVHAYPTLPVGIRPAELLSRGITTDLHDLGEAEAKKNLERAVRHSAVPPARRHVIGQHPVDAIQKVARTTRSSVVVMGAIARSGLKRLLIGNTAEQVLDGLKCDVLVVKHKGFKTGVRVKRRQTSTR